MEAPEATVQGSWAQGALRIGAGHGADLAPWRRGGAAGCVVFSRARLAVSHTVTPRGKARCPLSWMPAKRHLSRETSELQNSENGSETGSSVKTRLGTHVGTESTPRSNGAQYRPVTHSRSASGRGQPGPRGPQAAPQWSHPGPDTSLSAG